MPDSYDTPQGALYGLLLACFEPDELKLFFRAEYPNETHALPFSGTGETLASEAARVLHARGLVDRRLFERLANHRPAHHAAIAHCAAQWGLAPPPLPDDPPGRPAPPLQPGLTLAGYRLIRALGSGGYGSVWHARAPDGAAVALKILRPDFAHDAACRDRFFRGAERMQGVEHPRVVRVRELHRGASGHFFYVMQHIEGDDLRRLCKLGRVPRPSVLAIVAEIADALAACHDGGFVHRDVKPDNIVVDRHGAPYLTDFDFVTLADAAVLTQSAPAGTYGYLAPEVLAGGAAGVQADIYGLGATAVFALGGRDLRAPGDLARGIDALDGSEAEREVLRRATAVDPRARHPSMRALADDLRRLLRPDAAAGAGVLVERDGADLVAHIDGRRVVLRDLAELVDMLAAARRHGVTRVRTRGLTPAERAFVERGVKPGRAPPLPPADDLEPPPAPRPWWVTLAGISIAAVWLGWLTTGASVGLKPASLLLPIAVSVMCLQVLSAGRTLPRWLQGLLTVAVGALFLLVFLPALLTYPQIFGAARPNLFAFALLSLAQPAAVVASVADLRRPR